jgi:flagellar basal-body rod modification protein FlgD
MTGIGSTVGAMAEARVASALAQQETKTRTTSNTSTMSDGSNNSSTTTNAITASDFLTLLVSELKNQDPTQPTDPNAYISQLVGVNSLQQLIQINQDLAAIGTPSTNTTTTPS